MWLLLQGWLLRNVLTLLGWLAAAAAVAAVLFGARQAGRRRRVENMRRTSRCNVTSSRLRAVVLAIAVSLLAGCATERSDGAPCPPVVAYSRDFLARAADELASLPVGSALSRCSPTTR